MKTKRILQLIIIFLLLELCGCNCLTDNSSETIGLDASSDPIASTLEPTPPPSSVAMEPIACPMTLNTYDSLSVPTQITRIGDDYFLVDCYHNQILTSPSLDSPLNEWMVLTDQINRGHTIAGNGDVYLADDTENNRILIFKKDGEDFLQTQLFENIGNRPHYVEYDPVTERFYVLSSMSGELYVFHQPNSLSEVYLEKIMTIPGMQDVYIRSFTLDGDEIYFAASNGTILRTRLEDLTVLETYTLPDELAGLVQVVKLENYFYLTVSTDITGNAEYATIIRTKDLSRLQNHEYENLYEIFNQTGTPYYISAFDDHYYLTHHCYMPGHGVWQFDIDNDEICNVTILYP